MYIAHYIGRNMFETITVKDVKLEIGALVKATRKQRKLSQMDLASSLNVSRTTIQNLEIGKNFTIDTLLKVLRELDLLKLLNDEVFAAKNQVLNSKSLY